MFYCPNCKRKTRKQERKCPDCGGHIIYVETHRTPLIIAICILSVLLIGLIIVALGLSGILGFVLFDTDPATTDPSSIPGSSVSSSFPTEPSVPTTQPSEPSVPTEPTTPTTSPTQPTTGPVSGIGMYTREELEAMDATYNPDGFGAGRAPNHQRPGGPVSDQKKYEQYGGLFIGPDENNIYLTFDCGYEYFAKDENGNEYPVTGKILDVLQEKGVKAVFFVTMDYVKTSPDLVQRMVDEGHALGNHTVKHPVMPSKSIDRMEKEVMDLHYYILEKYGYEMTLFRPPTGAFSIQSLAVVQNLGYKSVLWSFQHYDYDTAKQPSDETAYKVITDNAHNGCIYLLHAVSEANANVLGDVIDNLQKEQGYTLSLLS